MNKQDIINLEDSQLRDRFFKVCDLMDISGFNSKNARYNYQVELCYIKVELRKRGLICQKIKTYKKLWMK